MAERYMPQKEDRYSVAWQQFLIAKKTMLAEYDQALAHAKEQPVSTHHGVVGEAAVRHWLGTFLPKRYGVTAGFVKSQGFTKAHQTGHFDVIIYDQLEAPTLWIEVNKDKSEAGRARIIPAEYVKAIIEVKAAFSRRTVREAGAKLTELEPLTVGVDPDGEKYPKFLPRSAVLAMLFFELRSSEAFDLEALNPLRGLELHRTFYGAVILRGEGLHPDDTGLVRLFHSNLRHEEILPPNGLLGGMSMTSTTELNGQHLGAMLMWGDINFSDFAFDLLALLNGTYRRGFASSMHGIDFGRKLDQT
jgi:hypothetical protein